MKEVEYYFGVSNTKMLLLKDIHVHCTLSSADVSIHVQCTCEQC